MGDQFARAKYYFEPTGDFDTGTIERYAILPGETLSAKREIIRDETISGTRSMNIGQVGPGLLRSAGAISFRASPLLLTKWLPRILGAAAVGTSFTLAETLPSFDALKVLTSSAYHYKGCKVNTGKFSASEGAPLILETDIVAKERVTDTVEPVGINLTADPFYTLSMGVFTCGGETLRVNQFDVTINNGSVAYFDNDDIAHEIDAETREVLINLTVHYNAGVNTLRETLQAATAAAFAATFTNGGRSISMTCPDCVAPDLGDPVISQKGRNLYQIQLLALEDITAGTKEIAFTNDDTA